MAAEQDERAEELESMSAIFPELAIDASNPFAATLELAITPTPPLLIRFLPAPLQQCIRLIATPTHGTADVTSKPTIPTARVEQDVLLAHLPPLKVRFELPEHYPENTPPKITLSTGLNWLPQDKVEELEKQAAILWEEYGHCQILYSYVDYLQQAAELGFDLTSRLEGCLVLPSSHQSALVNFNITTKQQTFDAGTYDCGVCLDPKKGTSCYLMERCGHVFCRQCLQDFYNNAITEGDVASAKCLDPSCGKTKTSGAKKRKTERTLHPRELLAMGVEESMVRRYVEMKRKKKLESDKSTVYCPRTWCQGPAKSKKYPAIPVDLKSYVLDDSSSEDEQPNLPEDAAPKTPKDRIPPDPSDRLAVCEKCTMAFCRVCYMGWHGPFARCFPRDPNELSAEEKASYDYIRLHTSPCPYCNAPVQKTMGCNHMNCFQCHTHFCYLCGSWLDAQSPYQHFNKQGTSCFQRLWELEEGDEGQAPEDGRGFGGARNWEQMAIDAAQEADAAEAEAEGELAAQELALLALRLNEPLGPLPVVAPAPDRPDDNPPPPNAAPRRGGRRQRQPVPARPPANPARPGPRPPARVFVRQRVGGQAEQHRDDREDREQAELQRFLEMARNDEEDGWDSDELGDDDDRFVIR